jgi:hypothetical protein
MCAERGALPRTLVGIDGQPPAAYQQHMGMMTRWMGIGAVVFSAGLAFGQSTTTVTTTSTTTTTTLFGGCTVEVSFTSVMCRLGALVSYVDGASDLGRTKGSLSSTALKAQKQCQKAANFATGKKASNQLKKCAKTIDTFSHKLDSHSAKQIIPSDTRSFLRSTVAGPLKSDVTSLRGQV